MDHQNFQINKKGLVILGLIALFVIILGAGTMVSNTVTFTHNGEVTEYKTTATTVEDFLRERNIEIKENANIQPKLETVIEKDMEVTYRDPITITILDNGKETKVESGHLVVEDVLKQHKIKVSGQDYTVPAIKSEIRIAAKKEPVIIINRVETQTTSETVVVPFDVITEENPDLPKGQERVVVQGVEGSKVVKSETLVVNDKSSESRVVSEEIVEQPVTEVREIGTKEVPTINGKNVVKTITMEATAYDPSPASNGKWAGMTALGTKLRPGVVAVDRNVIPLGTKLFIESTCDWPSYGEAVAEDVGGAIKGNRIDLLFMDRATCKRFGRRTVKVHVLAD